MIKQLGVLVVAGAVGAPGWTAERGDAREARDVAPKEERIGVGSGAAIGAIAGGPIGVILGAALGGWTGNKFHEEREQRAAAETELERSRETLASLERALHGSERELAGLQAELEADRRAHRAALERALDVEIFFRTAESELEPETQERLVRLGELIGAMDQLAVVVEGHADARGDETYNQQLSAARAEAVRDALVSAGVDVSRITTRAEGERFSADEDAGLDALALDRRVHLRIVDRNAEGRVAQQ